MEKGPVHLRAESSLQYQITKILHSSLFLCNPEVYISKGPYNIRVMEGKSIVIHFEFAGLKYETDKFHLLIVLPFIFPQER